MKINLDKISMTVNGAASIVGEGLQHLVTKGDIDYQPFMGHISDFTFPAAVTSYILLRTNSKNSAKIPISIASFLTSGEMVEKFTNFGINGGTYDPNDIACYWLGAGLAYGIHKIQIINFNKLNSTDYAKSKL
jgi:DNA phosphorothioation-dependent restriction protein DptG